jgi:hypothetical protein
MNNINQNLNSLSSNVNEEGVTTYPLISLQQIFSNNKIGGGGAGAGAGGGNATIITKKCQELYHYGIPIGISCVHTQIYSTPHFASTETEINNDLFEQLLLEKGAALPHHRRKTQRAAAAVRKTQRRRR